LNIPQAFLDDNMPLGSRDVNIDIHIDTPASQQLIQSYNNVWGVVMVVFLLVIILTVIFIR
jgi:heme/copper-type cytochrome/quinol oxidase subunit 2